MSIVEQAVDSIKTESSIKDICASHDDMIKAVRRELPTEMELDILETDKTEKPTNGSASKLKDAINETTTSLKAETIQIVNKVAAEQMDVDVVASNENGNGINNDDKPSKKNGETDVISGECKTGEEIKSEMIKESKEEADKPFGEVNTIDTDKETSKHVHADNSNFEESKIASETSKVEVENIDVEMSQGNGTNVQLEKVKNDIDKNKKDDGSNDTNDNEIRDSNNHLNNDETSGSKCIENEALNVEMMNTSKQIDTVADATLNNDPDLLIKSEVRKEDQKKVIEVITDDIKEFKNADNTSQSVDKIDTSVEQPTEAKKAKLDVQDKCGDEHSTILDAAMKEDCKENDADNKCKNAKSPGDTVSIVDALNNLKTEDKPSKNDNTDNITVDQKKDDEEQPQSMKDTDEHAAQMNDLKEIVETKADGIDKISNQQPLPSKEASSSLKEETCDRLEKSEREPLKEDAQEMVETNENENVKQTEKQETQSDAQNQPSEDQEMADVPEKTETQPDKLVAEEEPVNQTMYVDENRYFESGTMLELSRIAWTSTGDKQQYVRGCLWSPDGTCILAAVNMDGMHVINLPTDLYSNELATEERPVDKLESVINVKEGGTVYDYSWYPFMNSTLPESCCWISSRQHCPIQLWDGFTGELRGSYRGYDNVDEVEAAYSVTFTSDAEKIVGGYKKTIKIFDTKSPGREYSVIPTKQPSSCFAVQETQSNIIAAGSWNSTINLYDLRTPKLGSLVNLEEHSGGVTFLKFNASADSLFSGARKDNSLLEWDMRNFSKPLRKLYRTVTTNQRIYFDLSPGEKWLASGDTDCLVRVWDLKSKDAEEAFSFELHNDCCNGISFHPTRPMMATCSGQYHFAEDIDDSESQRRRDTVYENSLIFWWIGEMSKDKGTVDNPIPKVDAENIDEAEKMEA